MNPNKLRKRRKPPSHAMISTANLRLLQELDIPIQFAEYTCWACRLEFKSSRPEKAHIEPFSRGGSDNPSNFFLLCHECHKSQPDAADKDYQIRWIKSRTHFRLLENKFDTNPFATEFKIMSGISIDEFCNILIDKHGTKGMLSRFKNELKMGSLDKAGHTSGNAMANAVARLVLIYESEFK